MEMAAVLAAETTPLTGPALGVLAMLELVTIKSVRAGAVARHRTPGTVVTRMVRSFPSSMIKISSDLTT